MRIEPVLQEPESQGLVQDLIDLVLEKKILLKVHHDIGGEDLLLANIEDELFVILLIAVDEVHHRRHES